MSAKPHLKGAVFDGLRRAWYVRYGRYSLRGAHRNRLDLGQGYVSFPFRRDEGHRADQSSWSIW